MTLYNTSKPHDIDAVKTDGSTIASVQRDGGCTLPAGTYYFPVGSERSSIARETSLVSTHFKWNAALAATITFETCNFPATLGGNGQGGTDVTDYDSTAGNWIQENPATAYVPVIGSGNSATNLTITAGGSAAGGAMAHLGNLGSMRGRWKVVVTTQGILRVNGHGKQGA